jgi:DNA mismatch repair protein MutL
MGNIRILSEVLANQIAAGEVVERPASCVKELIENSLDAGAQSIRVAIEDGGISSIVVQDDGCGMDEEDAKLAFARHATSKIRHPRDLLRIATMGFRGEALASIAAVSRVVLQTRMADQPNGVEVTVAGGEVSETARPVGMPPGTRIEVRDLFYNTPARLKYLRSVATEQARCVDVVHKAALSRPDVAFRCDVGGHTVFQTSGRGDVREVLATLYGVGEARQFLELSASTPDYRVRAWIGRPNQAKASRQYGHLFVNHRVIRNLALHQAVVAGYGSRLMVNRHPVYALYIEMDPGLVDVNIHPHKSEVRFSEERDLVQLIQQAVRDTLDQALLVPDARIRGRSAPRPTSAVQAELQLAAQEDRVPYRADQVNGPGRTWHRPAASVPESASRSVPSKPSVQASNPPRATAAPVSREVWNEALRPPEAMRPPELSGESESAATAATEEVTEAPTRPAEWRLRPIGQALGMYIVADDGEHLYVIDQHAAHERVLYERFSKRMQAAEVHSIALLSPLSLSLSGEQYAAVVQNAELLNEMGLEFEPFGGRAVLLRRIPSIWEGLDYQRLVEDFLQSLTELTGRGDVRQVLRDVIVRKACKAAVKANEYLSDMEIDALCKALSTLEDPFHCPHGRPVFIRLSSRDLEKEFRRIV